MYSCFFLLRYDFYVIKHIFISSLSGILVLCTNIFQKIIRKSFVDSENSSNFASAFEREAIKKEAFFEEFT